MLWVYEDFTMNLNIKEFWYTVLRQDAEAIRKHFHPNAWVNWHASICKTQ